MTLLELTLLGGFQARLDPGGPVELPTRKCRALLAYLALHPDEAQPRETLADLLWSDRADRQANNSLSQAVTALRKALSGTTPAPLVIGPDSVTFVASAAEVDVLTFQQLAAGSGLTELDRVEALYQGDLLAGIGVRDPVFKEWLGFEQNRLRALAVGALTRLLACREEQGQDDQLVTTAHALLKLDPLQETAHRALMRGYAKQGQPGLALKQYETCAEALKKELGVEPDETTTRLRRDIIQRRSPAPAAAAPPPIAAKQARAWYPRWPAAAALAVALLASAGAVFWLVPWRIQNDTAFGESMVFPLPDKPSIVVLPFTNMSGDPEQDYFADGMTEDLITDLAKISGIFVISRNSAFTYKGRTVKTQRVAEDLGVRYVVEGSVRRVGDQVRINAQLIEATTGGHLWAERYDGSVGDVFALQDRVTERIVEALALELMPQEAERVALSGTDNVAAHDSYLLGLSAYYRRTPEDNAKAAAHFELAIQSDSAYWAAYTALAKVYAQAVIGEQAFAEKLGIFWAEGFTRARQLLEKGMARPNADYHVLRSWLALKKHQHEDAIGEAKRALELAPNDADALEALAEALIFAGQPEAGIEFAQRAMRQNPTLLGRPFYLLGLAAFAQGKPLLAVQHVERAIEFAPDNKADFSGLLAAAQGTLDHREQAERAFGDFGKGYLNRPAMAWSARSDAFANPRFHTWRRIDLAWSVYSFPFADSEVLDRLAQGFRAAGAPAGVGGYLPLSAVNRLTGPQIKSVLFGKSIEGKDFWLSEIPWRQQRSADGAVEHAGYPVHAGLPKAATGVDRIRKDMLCERWPALTNAAEVCVVIYRIPEQAARIRWGDYVMITDTGPHPFSSVE